MSGLQLVTLPIGNNRDLTFRAKESLEQAAKILAEDTRVLRDFCKHNDISLEGKKLDSFHDHTDEKKIMRIVEQMQSETIILVSDAGSPIISDPAFPIVQAALKAGLELKTAPGVSSVIVALELSGLPPSPFHFHAFIPRDKGKRMKFSEQIAGQYGTHIFFEGVSRVKDTLDILTTDYPEESFCVARELTKDFESVHRFKGMQWQSIKDEITYKGEFVILVHNSNQFLGGASAEVVGLANQIIDKGIHPKKLSKLLSHLTGRASKEIYQNLQK
jgi:16S rRNA (cytidine1402-2'-O)-methyltransferase